MWIFRQSRYHLGVNPFLLSQLVDCVQLPDTLESLLTCESVLNHFSRLFHFFCLARVPFFVRSASESVTCDEWEDLRAALFIWSRTNNNTSEFISRKTFSDPVTSWSNELFHKKSLPIVDVGWNFIFMMLHEYMRIFWMLGPRLFPAAFALNKWIDKKLSKKAPGKWANKTNWNDMKMRSLWRKRNCAVTTLNFI